MQTIPMTLVAKAIELHEAGMTWTDVANRVGLKRHVLLDRVYNTPSYTAKHRTVKVASNKPMFVKSDETYEDVAHKFVCSHCGGVIISTEENGPKTCYHCGKKVEVVEDEKQ